ncbi:hypothetical protein [Pseudomonas sp. NA-150]|uniref:hypothetical protein n=1 Tax=Pseudomonas sp. NA-150 TaxID=3367525 RepID=UPI0037C9AB5D
MNAAIEQNVARGLSASNEARQIMADWLRTTRNRTMTPKADARQLILARYPAGLISDAELEALLRVVDR